MKETPWVLLSMSSSSARGTHFLCLMQLRGETVVGEGVLGSALPLFSFGFPPEGCNGFGPLYLLFPRVEDSWLLFVVTAPGQSF